MVQGQRNPTHLGLPGRLLQARKRAALSLRGLADRAGVHVSVVHAIEGGAVPRLDICERLSRALGLSPCVIAYGIEAEFIDGGDLQCAGLGARLLRVREARAQPRKVLGRMSGTSDTTVREIEEGKIVPSVATAEKIAKALQVDPCWLAYGQSDAPELPQGSA